MAVQRVVSRWSTAPMLELQCPQTNLQRRLLDQPIGHRRDAKLPFALFRLRDSHPAYRTRPVCSQR